MKKTTLTIGIPTRNRADLISDILDDILAQMTAENNKRVKVLIQDNASVVSYSGVIEKYSKLFPPSSISYIRNGTDIGFSANIDLVVRSAVSDFVMIMSDDDGLAEGTIDAVLCVLDDHPDIGVGMLAHGTYDRTMKCETKTFTPSVGGYFENGAAYLDIIPSFPDALISGYVVNRQHWIKNFLPDFTAINSIHFIMMPLLIVQYPCFALGDRGYIKYRSDMGHWSIATDPLYPFPMYASYLKSCQVNKHLLTTHSHEKMYCSTMRTIMGFTIRNKVLGYNFPRKDILSILSPYFDCDTIRKYLYTIAARILMRVPMWMLYVPFRWLVPEHL